MRMIAGLEEPSTGDIWIGDRWVNDDLPKDRDIAMVFKIMAFIRICVSMITSPSPKGAAPRVRNRPWAALPKWN